MPERAAFMGDLDLSRDPPDLKGAMGQVGAPRLVILDPLMGTFGGRTDSYKDQHVRASLKPLGDLAREMDCAVVLVRHRPRA